MITNPDQTWANFCEFSQQVMTKHAVPGISVGILHHGAVQTAGFGVTNIKHPLSVTDETLFQIGSITKTFTGTAMMRLVEAGQVDLDLPIRTYLPDFAVADETVAAQATIRHLFTHMGGWVGDYFDDTGGGDDALARYVANMVALEQLAPLGTVWSYNNAGFSVAGYVIEKVTGQPFHQALAELVLEPLAMKMAFLNPTDAMPHRFATGHQDGPDGPELAQPWPLARASQAKGGLITHVKDLLRYAQFHLGDGTTPDGIRLLNQKTITQMQTSQVEVWPNRDWGLTWGIDLIDGVRQVWHSGGTVGQISLLALMPERNFALAVLTNAYAGRIVTEQLRRWALQHYLNLIVEDPEPLTTSETDLVQYVGHYSRPFATIDVGLLGGKLIAQVTNRGGFPTKDTPPRPSPPPMSLGLTGSDQLSVLDGPLQGNRLEVIRQANGDIGWIRFGSRIHPKNK